MPLSVQDDKMNHQTRPWRCCKVASINASTLVPENATPAGRRQAERWSGTSTYLQQKYNMHVLFHCCLTLHPPSAPPSQLLL